MHIPNIFFDNKNNQIILNEKIGSGGEGDIYSIEGVTSKVAKLYKANKLTSNKITKISLLVEKQLGFPGICIPTSVLNNSTGTVGYIMTKADGKDLGKTVFIKPQLEKYFPMWTRKDLVSLCISIIKKIKFLHEHKIIIGDINQFNILVTENENYFVDTDSYQVNNFPCPVGTIYFTAPEIQGKDYKSFLRTYDQEYFALATLVFMILLPGKAPYAYQGGGNPAENIKNKNFSYPFGDDISWRAPKGVWEFIWHGLPYEIKETFYNVFRLDKRPPPDEWLAKLEKYYLGIENGDYDDTIFPQSQSRNLEYVTTNIGGADSYGTDETRLGYSSWNKIGIIELSTKAVKYLSRSMRKRNDEFQFDDFYRKGELTLTGKGLDNQNKMDMDYFKNNVGFQIGKMVNSARDRGRVDYLYTIATAAYRAATNKDDILSLIKNDYGINVKILSKEEEANATLDAFLFSIGKKKNDLNGNYLLIDMGAGSVEISIFDKDGINNTTSMSLGTTVIQNILLSNTNQDTELNQAIRDTEKFIKDKTKKFLQSKSLPQIPIEKCVGVGTAITNATGLKGNKKQHGFVLEIDRIKRKIQSTNERLTTNFVVVGDIDFENARRNRIDTLLSMRFGLPILIEILAYFKIDEIVVSGTGLWYGIYAQKIWMYNENNKNQKELI